jgi:hypothetical protein
MPGNPGTYNFKIYRGQTFTRVVTYRDSAGALVNLTGYSVTFVARPSVNYGSDTISLSSGSGITLGGAAGTITITLSATATAALPVDDLVYSLKLTAAGNVDIILTGTITVEAVP